MASKDPFVETGFGRLAYRVDGQKATPLILLPRFRGTMDDWDPDFIASLANQRQVVRFDSAGVGRSEGDAPGTVAEMAAIVVAFLDARGLERVDVLGWSMGGFVAQMLALDSPDRVRCLVIAASSPGGVTGTSPPDPRVAEVAGKPINSRADLAFLFFADSLTSRNAAEKSLARIEAASTGSTVKLETVGKQAKIIGQWSAGSEAAQSRLTQLRTPTLVAGGMHDKLMPALGSFALARQAPNARLVLYPDAGHGFLFQYIDEFTGEVGRFIEANNRL
jgi:pimeloyl-ACP methyl ester carboxylesterase